MCMCLLVVVVTGASDGIGRGYAFEVRYLLIVV